MLPIVVAVGGVNGQVFIKGSHWFTLIVDHELGHKYCGCVALCCAQLLALRHARESTVSLLPM